jgi:hypothetical protein
MNKSDYFRKYGYACFDRHACLKPSAGLVSSVLLLCRSLRPLSAIGRAGVAQRDAAASAGPTRTNGRA